MFDSQSLETSFTDKTWKKGQRLYFANNIVSCALDGEIIRGTVISESSRDKRYIARIEYSKKRDTINSFCSCYVGYDCKHGAAIAQYYLLDIKASSGSSNRVIDDWINKINPQVSQYDNGRTLLYFLKPFVHDSNDYLQLTIKSTKQKKSGGWSRSLTSESISLHTLSNHFLNDDDVKIITNIIRNNTYNMILKALIF